MQKDTHDVLLGYLLWIFRFTGSHRFYYGRPVFGTIYFFTFGLLLVGWIIDLFLIPSMDRSASMRFYPGRVNYSVVGRLALHGRGLSLRADLRRFALTCADLR